MIGQELLEVVARDPMLRALAASFFCSAAAITALQAVLVVAAANQYGHSIDVGWLYGAVGAGGVVGSVVLLRWTPKTIRARGIAVGFLIEVIPVGLFAIVSGLVPALALLFVSTAAAAVYQTRGQTALQQRVPPEMLGRVNGVMRLLLYSGMLIGALAAVALVEPVGWSGNRRGHGGSRRHRVHPGVAHVPPSTTASRRGHPRRDTNGAGVRSDRDRFAGFLLDRQADRVAHSLHDPS